MLEIVPTAEKVSKRCSVAAEISGKLYKVVNFPKLRGFIHKTDQLRWNYAPRNFDNPPQTFTFFSSVLKELIQVITTL